MLIKNRVKGEWTSIEGYYYKSFYLENMNTQQFVLSFSYSGKVFIQNGDVTRKIDASI